MPNARTGFNDTYHQSRINHLAGTSYPAAPTNLYLGLYMGAMPNSAGTGGTEVSPATRPGITLAAPTTDSNNRYYVTHSAAVSSITLTNTAAGEIVGFGLFSATSGGTPIYFDRLPPFQVTAGQTISIPAGTVKVYAEPPTI